MLRVRPFIAPILVVMLICLVSLWPRRSRSDSVLRRITNTAETGISLNPSISGDGRQIAFESTEDLANTGGAAGFHAIHADLTANPTQFLQMGLSRAVTPTISQNGSRIAFASTSDPLGKNADGNSEIFLFDGSLKQITDTTPGSSNTRVQDGNFQPSMTDDGRFIAFSSNRNLAGQNADGNLEAFVFDTSSQTFMQITNTLGVVGAGNVKVSGDGSHVAYVRDRGTDQNPNRDFVIYDRVAGSTQPIAVSVNSLALTSGRAISDDGTRVVYALQTATNTTQVFLFDARANSTRQLTQLAARATDVPLDPTISGDGKRIAFATRRNPLGTNSDASVELFLYDIPTGQLAQLTNATKEATAEVVSSLNDDGSVSVFNFPRILSGAVANSDYVNNSEIYSLTIAARASSGTATILNGASLQNDPSSPKAIAPDSIVVAQGGALASFAQQAQPLSDGSFPLSVGGTSVTVNGRSAQVLYVSPGQVNFVNPRETAVGPANVVVTNSEGFQSTGSIMVLSTAPGVFTTNGDGSGEGVILNADTLVAGPFDPSDGNLRLIIFATGARRGSHVTAAIGGQAVTVESLLTSAELPGLDEIHVLVPPSLRGSGKLDVAVQSDNQESNEVAATFTGSSLRDIVINEILADPPVGLAGDANRDGVRSSSQDEFVELVNTTTHDIDISGYRIRTSGLSGAGTVRHVFANGTIFPAGAAIVVFGGANLATFNPNDPAFGGAIVLTASTAGLSLVNAGGVVTLEDPTGTIVNLLEYGGSSGLDGQANQSLTRAPDTTGNFTLHQSAPGSNGRLFGPGTHVDGSPFVTIAISRIDVTPATATIDVGAHQQFTARAFAANGQEIFGVIFVWQSSNMSVAAIDQNGLATAAAAGSSEIRASGRGVQSAPATLTARNVVRVLTRIDVSPSSAAIPVGGAQQFTARGFDQFGNEITGLTFTWESTNTTAATIDQNGLTTAANQGQTTIKASAQGVTGAATLNVTPPTVIINEALADPPGSVATDLQGDANHDGVRSASDDEFVELVNSTGSGINVSGWTVRTRATGGTTETTRHTFAAGTTLPASEAIVVFGGGSFNPNDQVFGCAQVVKASSGGLSLTNTGLTILIRDATSNLVTQFSYGAEGNNDQSLTRSPDITGAFVQHTTPSGANGRRFSPGLKLDGTPFGNCPAQLTSITISPSSASVGVGQTTQFTAQAFDQFGRAMTGLTITFASDNTTVATVDSVSTNPGTGIATATVASHNPGTAHITASATDGTATVNSSQATLTATGPALTINDVSLNEGNSGTTTFIFVVSLSTPAPVGGVTFNIATQDNTATVANNDYVARSLTGQTIAAGQQTYNFDVTVNGDPDIEPNETFFVNLTNVSGASIGDGQGVGTILNDDSPVLSISDVSANEGTNGTTAFSFTVSSTLPAPAGGITFDIATQDNAATVANNDYVARSLTGQTIPAGQQTYIFDVTVNGDTLVEPNETFFVNVTNVSGASVSDGQGLATIQNDDTAAVVISQIYGGGGNSGATFKNDFIEIFNRGTTTVDLAGWSVQQAAATGTSWSVTALCPSGSCLLTPGKYFLVQEASSGAVGSNLPAPDATGTSNLSATSGKIALVTSTTALTGSGCPFAVTVINFVGYGTTADCFEGVSHAPVPSNTTADFRKSGGCVDTNDNALDFVVSGTNPRNSSSPINDCSAGFRPDISINDVTVTEGDIGTKTVDFTVTLSAPNNTQTVTVNYATADGTATAGSDYQSTNGTVTFNPGQTSKPISITIIGDTTDEPNETFFVNLTSAANASILDNQGQGTITDDDVPPTLTINDVSLNEGNSGTTTFHFTVSLSAPALTGGVTFDIATQDNTATVADNDYVARSLTGQTIGAGQQTYNFDVTVNGDLNIEPNETLFVNVTNVSGATVGDAQGVGTIQNDDSPTLSINDVAQNEGSSGTTTFTFTVSSSLPAPAGGITFDIATQDNTATVANNDYVARSLTGQTIPSGQTSYTFDVTVNGDTLVEPNETFFVNLTNASGATIGDGQGVGTIQNDDTANLVISQVYAGGGNSGAQFTNDFVEVFNRGTTTVNLATTPYSIQYAGATATFGSSKVDLTSGVIAPGHYFLVQLSSGGANGAALPTPDATGSINMAATAGKVALVVGTTSLTGSGCPLVTTVSDFIGYGTTADCFEGSGRAPAPSNTTADLRKSGGCTDTNDNAADFLVSAPFPRNTNSPTNNCIVGTPPNLTINDVTVTEGNSGSLTATFTVSLSAPAPSTDVTFDIATQNNTATTANSDYVAKSLTSQVIPAGQQTYTFDVTVSGDIAVEPDETFFVNVTNVTGATLLDGQGIGTIQNDDLPTLSINDVTLSEGNSGTKTFTFNVSLSTAAPAPVTFDIATQDDTATVADNDYVARSLTGQTIPAGQQTYNFDVTVNGDLNVESNETFFVNLANVSGATVTDGQGVGTIQNDDSPTLSINDVSQNEGNSGTTTFTFTVGLSLPAPAGGVTFDIATQDNTATVAGNDYVTRSLTAQMIPAGQQTYNFDVTVNGDTLVEPNETFFVNVTNVSGATVSDGQGLGTIQNDDAANLVISQVYAGGGNSGVQFTNDFVEIFNRGVTTINLGVTSYSIQYAGATATFGSSKVDLTSGIIAPGNYFLVQLSSGGANGVALPTPDATGSINMAATAGKVALVAGTTALTGSGCPLGATVSDFVGYGTTADCFEGSGRAPAPSNTTADFRKSGGCTDTNDNAADFLVSAPFPRNTSSPTNNCIAGAPPNLTIDDVTVTEGNSGTATATFTVSLSAPAPSTDITFDIATQDNTAIVANSDYVTKSLTNQVIPAGQQTYSLSVVVNGDTAIENDETFFVNVTNVSGATLSDGQGVGTIQNDDLPTLSINDVTLSEGNSGPKTFTVTVSLSAAAPTGGVTFDIATQDNTATVADNDYVSTSLTGQTIPAGSQTYNFDVTVNGDLNIEPNETFFVNVTNVSGATVSDGQGVGTIQNDDSPALSINDVAINEGNSGTTIFTFTVSLSLPAPAGGVTFDIATQDNTATTANSDYVARNLTAQTIPAGSQTYNFDVTVNGDTVVEPDETFFVNVTNVSGATVSDSQGQGTIQNDDTPLLVISQVYGGGGNSSATYANDFIEIFNRGTSTIDFSVTPYSVQYAAATSNFSTNKTDITSGTLLPGHYFLIQEASGGAVGSALPTPDATGTINLAATAGKMALVSGTVALTGSGCPFGGTIVDFLGYGSTANCSETAPISVSSTNSNARSVIRTVSCTDTNNNSADFSNPTIAPTARNTATTPTLCP